MVQKSIAWVGKGIVYDTGGLSMKVGFSKQRHSRQQRVRDNRDTTETQQRHKRQKRQQRH